ncbi:MAG TPA: helix-turn-helix domain-containing protein [Tepidisphaeraceae bacterium]|nr:helix-turn-helix domain-containing protein [Tepidisphaeraceae bacterium]
MAHVAVTHLPFGIDHRPLWPLPQAHAHLDIEFILMERGGSEHAYRGERLTIGGGDLAVYWAGLPHRCVASDAGAMCYIIHLPLAWLLQWSLPPGFVQRLLLGEVFRRRRAESRWLLDRCRGWMRDRATIDAGAAGDIALLELQAACRRLAATSGAAPPAAEQPARGRRGDRMIRVGQMVHYLVHHYRQPLTAAGIAAAAGVHPNHAMRLFSQSLGVTLWGYVGQLRLAHAEYLLRTTEMPVIQVALEAGFASVGRFYLLFRKQFRETPRQFRLRMRSGEAVGR